MSGSSTLEKLEKRAVIKSIDMGPEMKQDAIVFSYEALNKFNTEADVAAEIKKQFDKRYLAGWHCIVGRNFSSYVTYEAEHFIYFYIGQTAILLWKH